MRKLKDILRLKFDCNLTNRQIARAVAASPSTVSYYVTAFNQAGLEWPLDESFSERQLIESLAPYCKQLQSGNYSNKKAIPDYQYIHKSLKTKGVTLLLLWQEYRDINKQLTYSYTEYCRRYREFKKSVSPNMRQSYTYGEKCFVDYAGPRVEIFDEATGNTRAAMIFVGVLGASNYTYVEATWTRSLADWLGSHSRMLSSFGAVPKIIIPDNEKSAVKDACYYDPELNPQYAELAAHYNCAIIPARPRHPQDKAKVETAVQITERWILAKLRDIKFYSLSSLNDAIKKLLQELNQKPFQKLPGSRQQLFNDHEKSQLMPLPSLPYEYSVIKRKKVRLDYHLELDGHYYSVPYQMANKTVEYHLSNNLIRIFYDGILIASHPRSNNKGHSSTQVEHMPSSHRAQVQWTPNRFLCWGQAIGEYATKVAKYHIDTQHNPECCYRINLGLMNLVKRYSATRFELACRYAVSINGMSFKSIKSILANRLENTIYASNDGPYEENKMIHHNIRGSKYYLQQQEMK
jgi:transposase